MASSCPATSGSHYAPARFLCFVTGACGCREHAGALAVLTQAPLLCPHSGAAGDSNCRFVLCHQSCCWGLISAMCSTHGQLVHQPMPGTQPAMLSRHYATRCTAGAVGWQHTLISDVKGICKVSSQSWTMEDVKQLRMQATCWTCPLPCNIRVTQVAAGEQHSMALDTSGSVWTFGSNGNGQLGTGDTAVHASPTCILGPSKQADPLQACDAVDHSSGACSQIACGARHSCAILQGGVLFCWGWSAHGQAGHGVTQDVMQPRCVEAFGGLAVVSVAAGSGHTVACTDDGSVYTFGLNESGQLGLGHTDSESTPQLVEAIDEECCKVSAGARHCLALSRSGLRVFAWGFNKYGQLGIGRDAATATAGAAASATPIATDGSPDMCPWPRMMQLPLPPPPCSIVNAVPQGAGQIHRVVDIAGGWWHSAVIVEVEQPDGNPQPLTDVAGAPWN